MKGVQPPQLTAGQGEGAPHCLPPHSINQVLVSCCLPACYPLESLHQIRKLRPRASIPPPRRWPRQVCALCFLLLLSSASWRCQKGLVGPPLVAQWLRHRTPNAGVPGIPSLVQELDPHATTKHPVCRSKERSSRVLQLRPSTSKDLLWTRQLPAEGLTDSQSPV